MAEDEKDSFIPYLVDKVNTYELDKRATELSTTIITYGHINKK